MKKLMRQRGFGAIVFVALLALSGLCLDTTGVQGKESPRKVSLAPIEGWSIPEHEKFTFLIKWTAIPAGEITVETKGIEEIRGRKAYKIEVHARTKGFCSTLYKVDSHYTSYLDVEKLYTLRHEVHRREGSYRKDAVTDFDQEKHIAYFKNDTDGSEKTFAIPPDTQDTVTALYIARFSRLSEEKPLEIRICNNEQNYVAVLNVIKRSSLVVPRHGKRPVFLVKPTEKYGKNVREGRMTGYVGVEPGHEPYLFAIKAPVFTSVTARLVKIN
jgi:hypothetical protein